jgi:hypothetical protein
MTMNDPKSSKPNQKQESSGVGTMKSQMQRLTSFGYSEAPNYSSRTPDSSKANANYSNLGMGITLQNSSRQDSMLGMIQRSKSG